METINSLRNDDIDDLEKLRFKKLKNLYKYIYIKII